MPTFHVRPETPGDATSIAALIDSAFAGVPYADGDEADLVAKLRSLGDLSVSLVAEEQGRVVGHIAFSPARPADGTPGWFSLGPIAVVPERRGAGIGSALVTAGIEAIAKMGARGCILVGYPGLYARCGFVPAPNNAPSDQPAEFFMYRLLSGDVPAGPIHFHEAFTSAA